MLKKKVEEQEELRTGVDCYADNRKVIHENAADESVDFIHLVKEGLKT
jgi:hypothetical protein